jgi:hypothetical protein
MSTAVFPQGTQSYNNTQTAPFSAQYRSWKGQGINSNPVAITAGNIRPLTNNDLTNIYPQKMGLPRPLKWQYRKGSTVPVPVYVTNQNDGSVSIINANREVKSSKSNLVGQLIDRPGEFSVKANPATEFDETSQANLDCINCRGISVVTDYYPNKYYLTNNPQPSTPANCCNEERKALKRVLPASTNVKKNYYQTTKAYLQNRCKTYEQKAFNFYAGPISEEIKQSIDNNPLITPKILANAKPGGPLGTLNLYFANCYPNTGLSGFTQLELVAQVFEYINNAGALSSNDISTFYTQQPPITTFQQFSAYLLALSSKSNKTLATTIYQNFITNPYWGMSLTGPTNPAGCKLTVYKPSNPQFATQGGVESSTRTLKIAVTTIEKNVANTRKLNGSNSVYNYQNNGGLPFTPFIYKTKTPACQKGLPFYWQALSSFANPTTCFPTTSKFNSNLGQTFAGPNPATNGIGILI